MPRPHDARPRCRARQAPDRPRARTRENERHPRAAALRATDVARWSAETLRVSGHKMTRIPILSMLVVLAAGALVAQQSDTTRNPLGASPAAVAAGRVVYDQT